MISAGSIGEVPVLLAKPQTYMNFSGESVSSILHLREPNAIPLLLACLFFNLYLYGNLTVFMEKEISFWYKKAYICNKAANIVDNNMKKIVMCFLRKYQMILLFSYVYRNASYYTWMATDYTGSSTLKPIYFSSFLDLVFRTSFKNDTTRLFWSFVYIHFLFLLMVDKESLSLSSSSSSSVPYAYIGVG